MFVLDSHCDTPSAMLEGRNLSLDNKDGHVDFPKLRRGGIDAAFFALYTSNKLSMEDAHSKVLRMLAGISATLKVHGNLASLATSPEEAYSNKSKGLFSIFLGMENGSPIMDSLQLLDYFYDEGVRYLTLTHNEDNQICDSAAGNGYWNGLSPFGKDVIHRMNSLGMIVDIAHCSDKTFYDCLEISETPIVSTHSNCRALASHFRNLSDEMLKELGQAGGVCQINFYPAFLSDDYQTKLPSYKRVVDHIEHAVNLAGIDHVGIGSDFDGIELTPLGLENAGKMPVVFEEMRRRGFSNTDIEKIAGGNFMRVFDEVIEKKKILV